MTGTILDIELSGLVFTGNQKELFRDEIGRPPDPEDDYDQQYDYRTFVYDCFWDADTNEVVLLCPELNNFRSLLDAATFAIDGVNVTPKSVIDKSRCSLVSFDTGGKQPKVLSITHELFGGNMVVGQSYLDHFSGTNVIYTISQNNRLEWIQDWLEYYVKAHRANAVVISDNQSSSYSPGELIAAIGAVPGIEKAAVIRARYPFGPIGKESYSALFLQRSLAELCRRRFLGQAHAVVNADVDELFYSFSGQSIFDATAQSDEGYIRADADWVYSKGRRDGSIPRHANHEFVSKSGKPKSNRKWCVAPQGPQKGRQWLTHFLGSRRDAVDPDFRLWHFRQISTGWKFRRDKNQDLELEPNPELATAMRDVFGEKQRMPVEQIKPMVGKRLVITSMKNEGPYILEWIAYHRVIGFNDFLVYTNDCSDGTDDMLDRLQELGIVKHVRNKVLRRGPQKSALKNAMEQEQARTAEWILVSDIDEFLNIKIGQGQLQDLLDAVPDADVIPVTWKLFSNDQIVDFNDELTISTFSDSESGMENGGQTKRFAKSLFKPHPSIERFGTHGPIINENELPSFRWLAPDGRRIEDAKEMTRPKIEFSYDFAQFNHYATRCVDAYLVKKDRGRVNHYKQIMEIDYWKKMCLGGEEDRSIQRHVGATRAEIERLMQDAELANLHKKSFEWYESKILELRDVPEFESMREEILKLP